MIKSIEVKTARNGFLKKLQTDVKTIRSSKDMLVFADKSTNLYKVSRQHYEKLLHDNIMQTYKRASPVAKKKLTKNQSNLQNISESMIEWNDHKNNFKNNPKCSNQLV